MTTTLDLPAGVQVNAPILPGFETILTRPALELVALLHRDFDARRQQLLELRRERAKRLDAGERPDFLAETADIRAGDWKITPVPKALECRRVEITGPVDAKMVINAFNSGADSYMTDFEDSNSPSWSNQIQGQLNIKQAIRRTLTFAQDSPAGTKTYKLNDKIATLQVRPRGWHLDEKHVLIDGRRVHGGIFDFALFMFHNAKELLARGAGPYLYLPKVESHLEARLWNEVFVTTQNHLGLPKGTVRATVLIETILAAFEMDEILWELREHSAGLNAGRWDYIFSCIKKFKNDREFCLADRAKVTMTAPFMRSYALLLLQTCHKRGAPAIGGMSALIPIKNDPVKNEKAMAGIIEDKRRDADDGYDGGWVAHPGLVEPAMKEFVNVLGDRPNQFAKQRPDVQVKAADLLDFRPETAHHRRGPQDEHQRRHPLPRRLARRQRLRADPQPDGRRRDRRDQPLAGVAVDPLAKGVLDDGRKVTADLVRKLVPEELAKIKAGGFVGKFDRAAEIFTQMSTQEAFAEFLTLPLYEEI
jgi:malate synthase